MQESCFCHIIIFFEHTVSGQKFKNTVNTEDLEDDWLNKKDLLRSVVKLMSLFGVKPGKHYRVDKKVCKVLDHEHFEEGVVFEDDGDPESLIEAIIEQMKKVCSIIYR